MKRNIVKQGPTTLMISLPSKWVQKYNLKKGEQLEITEIGRKLEIETDKNIKKKEITIELISDHRLYIWRTISALYYSGYDKIHLNFNSIKTLEEIQKFAEQIFIGFEMTDLRKNYCLIESISNEKSDNFDTIVRRLFLGIIQMSNITNKYLQTKDTADLSLIPRLEQTNNRQSSYLKRILNKEGYKVLNKTTFAYTLVYHLALIADEYKYMNWGIQQEIEETGKVEITEKIKNNFSLLQIEIENVYKLYFKYSNELVEEIITRNLMTDSKSKTNLDLFCDNPRLAHTIISITDRIRNVTFQIIGINN